MSKYLITFDMDTNCLKENYHGNNWNNAYYDIANILGKHGFNRIQGSVYLGEEGISEAHGTIALQELTATYDWFYACVSNVRFYRIESDLDAQFVLDGVHQAKQRFNLRIESLRQNMLENGLTEQQIENILKHEQFDIKQLNKP